MLPIPLACNVEAGFILMDDVRLDQGLFDLLLDFHQLCRTSLDQLAERAFTHLHSQQVAHHLTGSGQRHQLLLVQIHCCCGEVGSILDGSRGLVRKRSRSDVLTGRTLFVLSTVFADDQMGRRDIDDLSALHMTGRNGVQILLTGFTVFHALLNHFLRGRRPLQARPRMSWLPSRWLLALFAQAFWLPCETIRRRRQMTIVAVFREPILQGFHLLSLVGYLFLELFNQLSLLLDHLSQHGILLSKLSQFFFWSHAFTLHLLRPVGKP